MEVVTPAIGDLGKDLQGNQSQPYAVRVPQLTAFKELLVLASLGARCLSPSIFPGKVLSWAGGERL